MIFFIHVPGFYAAVEQADHAELRGRPVIVGGDPTKRGSVTGVSPEGREMGVLEGMDVRDAQLRCPDAVLRPTRMSRYRELSAEMRAILRNESIRMEGLGLDGTYLEAPPEVDPVSFAAELCVQIRAELGVSAVAGIGPTRFVAYLAAKNPNAGGIRIVSEESAPAFLAEFPVTEIWGLGPKTAERLAVADVSRIADLQQLSVDALRALVDRNAGPFLALARGEGIERLRPSPRVKSLSRERTLEPPTGDLGTLGEHLGALAGSLEEMLRRERREARTVGLGLGYTDGERVTRSQTGERAVTSQNEIVEVALRLLARTQAGVRQIRRLQLQVSNLRRPVGGADPRQLRLF